MTLDIQYGLRLVFTFIVAGLISFTATPIVKSLAHKFGAIDIPKDERRIHKKPTARLGGLAIFYGFLISILCFCDIETRLQGILMGAVIIVTLGILDDIFNIKAWIKLIVQIIAAVVVVWSGVGIDIITNPFPGGDAVIELGHWGDFLTVLWIVGVTNAVNLIDGLDGLAAGISTITAITLLTVALITGDLGIALVCAALIGACIGFLPFNFYPASIFMGDTGSTFLGYILACISILGLFKVYAVISFVVPFLVLGIPIFDTGFTIMRRIFKGQSPMKADRGHLHHRLIDMGFTQKQAVLVLYITSALLSLSAVVLVMSGPVRAPILILAVLLLLIPGKHFISAALNNEEEINDVQKD